ncbi:hypothetical protein HD554DRAFT_2017542 [Boletus coccyginus]|nr:hypothetical protein HD554DRAFT_2017542 [Boletus coccyginus]
MWACFPVPLLVTNHHTRCAPHALTITGCALARTLCSPLHACLPAHAHPRHLPVNEYVALCEPGFILFGGRDGHYGLYLDTSLLDGSSVACSTFGNLPLCAAMPHASVERNGVVRAKADMLFECGRL